MAPRLLAALVTLTRAFPLARRLAARPSRRLLATTPVGGIGDLVETTPVGGIGDLVDDYDVFLLDQYGVLHNGGALLPGCGETLRALHEAGKKLVVLSNTSKRRQALVDELPGRGFSSAWLADAVCSGEVCWRALRARGGGRAVVLGWASRGSAEYLEGTGVELGSVDAADVLVAYGPDTISTAAGDEATGFMRSGDVGPYAALLERGAARGLPMLCANPDQVSVDGDGASLLHMPGALCDAYRALGGDVVEFGKPGVAHFREAVEAAGLDAPRVLHVGDSLKHDVAGAAAAGVASLFVVETGVHAGEIAADPRWPEDPRAAVAACAAKYDVAAPTFSIAKFAW